MPTGRWASLTRCGAAAWRSRVAQPRVHAWTEADQPWRLVEQTIEQTVATADPDPKALSCYGLLLRRVGPAEAVWLRFVTGRPVRAITIQFLEWCCPKLAALGVPVWALIGDNACWHVSKAVHAWIRAHNRQVKHEGHGVRILACASWRAHPGVRILACASWRATCP
jgi:hypothetical protein